MLRTLLGAIAIVAIAAASAGAISVDGDLSDWPAQYKHTDATNDKAGDIEMVEWGAMYSGGTLYSYQKVAAGPSGETLKDQGDSGPWADLWLDVDNNAATQVGAATAPQALNLELGWAGADISFEFSTGGAQPALPYVQLYGSGNDWFVGGPLPSGAEAAFSTDGLTIEFSCPLSAIVAELPNTDGATVGTTFRVGTRIDGVYPGSEAWGADVSSSETLLVPEPGTVVLLATSLLGLLAYAWRKRR